MAQSVPLVGESSNDEINTHIHMIFVCETDLQIVMLFVYVFDLNDPTDANDMYDWMTGSFADD